MRFSIIAGRKFCCEISYVKNSKQKNGSRTISLLYKLSKIPWKRKWTKDLKVSVYDFRIRLPAGRVIGKNSKKTTLKKISPRFLEPRAVFVRKTKD